MSIWHLALKVLSNLFNNFIKKNENYFFFSSPDPNFPLSSIFLLFHFIPTFCFKTPSEVNNLSEYQSLCMVLTTVYKIQQKNNLCSGRYAALWQPWCWSFKYKPDDISCLVMSYSRNRARGCGYNNPNILVVICGVDIQ